MHRRRSSSMYSPHFERPGPGEDGGWRQTFFLVFAIIGILGVGSVLMIARTVGALDVETARIGTEAAKPATHAALPESTTRA